MPISNNILAGSGQSGADLGNTIEQSLRFAGDSSALVRTATAAVTGDWTISFWMKMDGPRSTGADAYLYMFGAYATTPFNLYMNNNKAGALDTIGKIQDVTGNYTLTGRYRDPTAWYHIVMKRASNVLTGWVNGSQVVTYSSASTMNVNNGELFSIGDGSFTSKTACFDGYMADWHFVDGQAKDATDFGRYNEDGVWVPKTYTGTYGNQGFHLTFDSSQDSNALTGIGIDSSGNNNHFTAKTGSNWVAFETTAISSSNFDNDIDYEDTPTNNTATLNPLVRTYNTLSEANLKWDQSSTNDQYFSVASMRMDQPTYGEMVALENTNGSYPSWGVCNEFKATNVYQGYDIGGAGIATDPNSAHYLRTGGRYVKGTYSSPGNLGGPTFAAGDIVRWTFNPNNGECRVAVNGGSFFTWHTFSTSEVEDEGYKYFCAAACNTSGAVNFGNRPFVYSIPTGFKALQTNNLDQPTIKNGKEYFGVLTYQGNGTSQTITDTDAVQFTPDLVWIKKTDSNGGSTVNRSHILVDSVRGKDGSYYFNLSSNDSASETSADHVSAIGEGSITVHDITSGEVNANLNTYVAWCWKAGGAATANGNGSIASQVSANTKAGFSIVSYSGVAPSTGTVGHGLSSPPEFMIVRNRDDQEAFAVYHQGVDSTAPEDYWMRLDSNTDRTLSSTHWNDIAPGNSFFTVGTANATNGSGNAIIAYCWHSVEGYSKFGSYTGNGSDDGTFVYLGFRPAFLMVKRTNSTGHWMMIDTTRSLFNPANNRLHADLPDNEYTNAGPDILSNGFKMRNGNLIGNFTGGSYIYAAFAENPFGGENTPPATAR